MAILYPNFSVSKRAHSLSSLKGAIFRPLLSFHMGDRKLRVDHWYSAITPWHRYVRSYVLDLWNSSIPLWHTRVNSSNKVQHIGKVTPGRQQTQTPGRVSWSLLGWAGCSAALLVSWYLRCWEAQTRQLGSLDRYSRPRRHPGMI